MTQADPTPAGINHPHLLLDVIALAVRDHARDYWIRRAERPELLVLAGRRVWEVLLRSIAGGHPWWRVLPLRDELVGLDGIIRIVAAGIEPDEWQLVVLAESRGSIGS